MTAVKPWLFALLWITGCFFANTAAAQENVWKTLAMVQLQKKYDETYGYETIRPVFGPLVQKLEGKQVQLSGYIIPVTGKRDQSHIMFSLYPNSTCFFCGKAGPETAMQVFMRNGEKVRYTEEKVTFKGTLRLNEDDPSGLIYTLADAELIK